MQKIVTFRWFVLLSRVQGKNYLATSETFPNLLFSTLTFQYTNALSKGFCSEKFNANSAASAGFSGLKFVRFCSLKYAKKFVFKMYADCGV